MSILKIKDSQGNWVGVPTVKGDTGNGISSAVLNDDYTLTLTFTDGTTYKTPSIRGEKGERGEPATDMDIHICSASEYDAETRIPTIANPNDKTFYLVPTEDGTSPDLFTEWVYVNGAWEMFGSAKIDLSGYLTDVKVNGNSVVTDGVAELSIEDNGMVVTATHVNGTQYSIDSSYDDIKTALAQGKTVVMVDKDDEYHTIHPYVGNGYIDDGWFLAFGISATYDGRAVLVGFMIPEYYPTIAMRIEQATPIPNFTDVWINGTSIVENGAANIPIASDNKLGVVKTNSSYGISSLPNGILQISASTQESTKEGTNFYGSIVPANQHAAVFYGLAKASGHDEKDSTLSVGQYTDEAKSAIQTMLGIADLIGNSEGATASQAYSVGDVFLHKGKLYKVTASIAQGSAIVPNTNCSQTTIIDLLRGV